MLNLHDVKPNHPNRTSECNFSINLNTPEESKLSQFANLLHNFESGVFVHLHFRDDILTVSPVKKALRSW